jgi:hypothetical protein
MLISFLSIPWGIAFIVGIQFISAVAPRFEWFAWRKNSDSTPVNKEKK